MTTPNLLGTIVAATRHAVEARQQRRSLAALTEGSVRAAQGGRFTAALRAREFPRIIAECKRRSPSKGILRREYDPAAHACAYAAAGAAAISVLTEPTFFDGAPEHLERVRAAVDIPILRKDFIVSSYQLAEAAALGADAVLLIVGALADDELQSLLSDCDTRGLAALVEVHDSEEAARAVAAGAAIVGVNCRDLRTLSVDPAVHDRIARSLPDGIIKVAESGIRTRADLDRLTRAGYDAFLVGERLITQPDPGAALRVLLMSEADLQNPSDVLVAGASTHQVASVRSAASHATGASVAQPRARERVGGSGGAKPPGK
jgi:indole-3-glycerol phosphate synthase